MELLSSPSGFSRCSIPHPCSAFHSRSRIAEHSGLKNCAPPGLKGSSSSRRRRVQRRDSSQLACRSMAGGAGAGAGAGAGRGRAAGNNNNKNNKKAAKLAPGRQDRGGLGFAAAAAAVLAPTGAGAISGREQAWPALKKRNLPLQSRRELRGLDLFSIPGFLSSKECKSFIRSAEALGFQQQGSLGPRFGEAFRDNGRVSLQSSSIADELWEAGLSTLFRDVTVDGRRAVGLNPNIRFYRYIVGQKFGQHIDESAEVGGGRSTQYTLLIYLTGGGESSSPEKPSNGQLVGGETVFYDKRRVVAEVPPVAGMALLHIHGEQCLLHEARVVLKGVKYVMRSDVVFD